MKKRVILNRLLRVRNLGFKFFPLKIRKFRKAKWAFLKNNLIFQFREDTPNFKRKLARKRARKTNNLLNFLKIKRNYRVGRLSHTYRAEQNEKRALSLRYGGAIKNKYGF